MEKLSADKRRQESLKLMKEDGEIQWQSPKNSKIAQFYSGKNVLVTGASGFLGTLLIEKLLRACPEIDTVYILLRPKKDQDEIKRLKTICSNQIFGPLAKLNQNFHKKIKVIKGDATLPQLGISAEDQQQIREKINVIFHGAATVRFDETLSVATAINVRATRDLLNLARQCKSLEAFVHISTAYSNCHQPEIDEVFYQTPISAEDLINTMEKTSKQDFDKMADKYLKVWPNTYTFTKALAENVIKENGKNLPISVVRPSIVIATYREPLRSWINNFYGATGIVIGAGTGILKSVYCKTEKTAELVPADYVINCTIAASYQSAISGKTTSIYNYVSGVENRYSWADFARAIHTWGITIPTMQCIWYLNFTMNRYYVVHVLFTIFLQYIPAYIMDLGLILISKRPRMVRLYTKVAKLESVLAYFMTHQWKYSNNNTQNLWKNLTEDDQMVFPFSIKHLDWSDYYKTYLLGVRIYLLKDDITTIPQALKKWKRFFYADLFAKMIFRSSLFYLIYLIYKFFV